MATWHSLASWNDSITLPCLVCIVRSLSEQLIQQRSKIFEGANRTRLSADPKVIQVEFQVGSVVGFPSTEVPSLGTIIAVFIDAPHTEEHAALTIIIHGNMLVTSLVILHNDSRVGHVDAAVEVRQRGGQTVIGGRLRVLVDVHNRVHHWHLCHLADGFVCVGNSGILQTPTTVLSYVQVCIFEGSAAVGVRTLAYALVLS